uniref:Uncharacterized protein n=1 Tax=Monodelphis domestica TaxID=13616 RepID=A0A5F8G8G2_MONDO
MLYKRLTSLGEGITAPWWMVGKAWRRGMGQEVMTRSEEYLARVSTELTNEALMGAQYPMSPDVPKELKKLDQGTQMSRHVLPTTRTKGTDTR